MDITSPIPGSPAVPLPGSDGMALCPGRPPAPGTLTAAGNAAFTTTIASGLMAGNPCVTAPRPRRAWGESPMSSSEISVRVSDEILWIGSEAYPLRNIARVQPVKVVPGRGRAFRGYLIAIVICVLLIAAGVVAEKTASHVTSTQVYKVLH